jgi:uncharacterized protein YegJ (DUF2314 family)
MRGWWVLIAVIAACKGSSSNKQEPPTPPPRSATPATGQPVRVGEIKRTPTEAGFAVIAPPETDLAALEQLSRARAKERKLTIELLRSTARDLDVTRERAQYMIGGVDAADFDVLERGVALMLAVPSSNGLEELRALSLVAAAAATSARGWVLDPDIGGLFTSEAFAERVATEAIDARTLIGIHAVGGEEREAFLDTVGMRRLGLPDLYVRAAAPSQLDALIHLINATAQTLILRGDISRPNELDVDVAQLDATWGAEAIQKAGGSGRVTWRVRWSRFDAGDEDHEDHEDHLELVPPSGSTVEDLARLLSDYFGAVPDDVVHVDADDPELLSAGKRARADLHKMRAHFAKGVPAGERLAVKARFTSTDGEVEWMWVDVIMWRRDELTGFLDNDPRLIPTLRSGSRVTVKLTDVSDYMYAPKDGSSQGGYSIEVMRKRGLVPR